MKTTPLFVLILMIGVISISGCITILEPENNTIPLNKEPVQQNKEPVQQNTTQIETPKISGNDAVLIVEEELKNNYSIYDARYTAASFTKYDNYYNVTINKVNNGETAPAGSAIVDANSGKITKIIIENTASKTPDTQRVYSSDEAGAYIDIIYQGELVGVRENYPYYSPQNHKVYYSQQEEAEDLYQMALDMK